MWEKFVRFMKPLVPLELQIASVIECIVEHHRVKNAFKRPCLVLFGMDEILKVPRKRQKDILQKIASLQESSSFVFVPFVTSLSQNELKLRVVTECGRDLEVCEYFAFDVFSLLFTICFVLCSTFRFLRLVLHMHINF